MKIIQWAIDREIDPLRAERSQDPQEAIDKVAASIKEFGWRQPIVVDSERVVVAGHVRLLAAKQLGLEKVPVHVATDLTPGQIKAFRLMDNRSHQESGWDMELLGPEIAELPRVECGRCARRVFSTLRRLRSSSVRPARTTGSPRTSSSSTTNRFRPPMSVRSAVTPGAAQPGPKPEAPPAGNCAA